MKTIKIKIIDFARKREVKRSIHTINKLLNPVSIAIDADVEHRSAVVPTMTYKGKGRYHVADAWLRDHITPDHKQYHAVCFSFEDKDWYSLVGKKQNSVGGTEFGRVEGVPVFAMTATRGQKDTVSGFKTIEWIRRFLHELLHVLSGVYSTQKDRTHYWDYKRDDLIEGYRRLNFTLPKRKIPSQKPQKPHSDKQSSYTKKTLNKLGNALNKLKSLLPRIGEVLKEQVNIFGLKPRVYEIAEAFIEEASDYGYDLRITSGFRSYETQNKLYAQGRTAPGNIVTYAKAGQSAHNFGIAFDVVDRKQGYDINWKFLGELSKKYRLDWGGDWNANFQDRPHFAFTAGYSLKAFQQGNIDWAKFR